MAQEKTEHFNVPDDGDDKKKRAQRTVPKTFRAISASGTITTQVDYPNGRGTSATADDVNATAAMPAGIDGAPAAARVQGAKRTVHPEDLPDSDDRRNVSPHAQDVTSLLTPSQLEELERRKAERALDPNDTRRITLDGAPEVLDKTRIPLERNSLQHRLHTVILFARNSLSGNEDSTTDKEISLRAKEVSTDPPELTLSPQYPEDLPHVEDKFDLLCKIAKGGQGIISKAKDKMLRRMVAIKSLRRELLDREAVREKFIQEALITAQLDHPSIIPIHSLMRDDENGLHLSMKLLQGKTLHEHLNQVEADFLKRGCTQQNFSARIQNDINNFLKVCEAVSYAHSRHIIHCDLKPDNIMLGHHGEVYVMDWGLARVIQSEEGRNTTPSGKIKLDGTPRFIPPEAYAGVPRDERADIFALGLILYEIITLRPAYNGNSVKEIVRQVRTNDREPVQHRYGFRIRKDLEAIVEKACAYDPVDRYQTVDEFSRDLMRYLNDDETDALPDSYPRFLGRYIRHHMGILVALALIGWASALLVSMRSLQKRERTAEESLLRSANIQHRLDQEINQRSIQETHAAITSENCREALQLSDQLRSYANRMNELGVQAALLLEGDAPRTPPANSLEVYSMDDFPEEKAVFSPNLDRKIGLDFCTYLAPPETPGEKARAQAERLAALTPLMSELVLCSGNKHAVTHDREGLGELKKDCAETGTPILQVSLRIADSGLQFCYPGHARRLGDRVNHIHGSFQDAWKEGGFSHFQPLWSLPYKDESTGVLVLDCTLPILDNERKFLGTVAMKMRVSAFETLLQNDNPTDYMLEQFVLGRNGEKIYHKVFSKLTRDDSILKAPQEHIPPPIDIIFQDIFQSGRDNYFNRKDFVENGYEVTYHYAAMDPVNLYLITKVSRDRMLEHIWQSAMAAATDTPLLGID